MKNTENEMTLSSAKYTDYSSIRRNRYMSTYSFREDIEERYRQRNYNESDLTKETPNHFDYCVSFWKIERNGELLFCENNDIDVMKITLFLPKTA